MKLFIHGIPHTPVVWTPLLEALALKQPVSVPPLPGVAAPAPEGFAGTPDAYVNWLIAEMEAAAVEHGPLDLVGHDWGALFVVRAACLRPDLVRTWAAANAVPSPDDPWPLIARLWATPIIGEILMAILPSSQVEKAFARQRMSEGMAAHEAAHWKRQTRRATLKLYRTGLRIGAEWDGEIAQLPPRGLVLWGGKDPYTKPETAEAFCARTGAKLQMLDQCGHFSIIECADQIAALLKTHWKR